MQLNDAIVAEWKEQATQRRACEKCCCSCIHLEVFPFHRATFRAAPDGRCKLLDVSISNADTAGCAGWQTSMVIRRRQSHDDVQDHKRSASDAEKRLERAREELSRRAPRTKVLRRIVG